MAGHTHGATSGRLLWISLGLTAVFVVAEVLFGLRAHSLALLSDAGHNASDALALGLAAYAVWVARRPANPGKTFGYHRVAILTALINAAALVVIALGILVEAWQSFLHPHAVQGNLVIGVAVVAVVMNTVIAYWLQGNSPFQPQFPGRICAYGGRCAFLVRRRDRRTGHQIYRLAAGRPACFRPDRRLYLLFVLGHYRGGDQHPAGRRSEGAGSECSGPLSAVGASRLRGA